MSDRPVSRLLEELRRERGDLTNFVTRSAYAGRAGDPAICDFVFGNPHELPLPEFEEALRRWSHPQRPDWFAYKTSDPGAQRVVAESLRAKYGIDFDPLDVAMTNGAFAGLAVVLTAVVDPGDEVVFLSPPWFGYLPMILAAGARPARVKLEPPDFEFDAGAVAAAITERTRAVIVNTPHNPTGRILSAAQLESLARVLADASASNGRRIYLISDEAYSGVVFEDSPFLTPTAFYPNSFLVYTYGKILLTPGQRIGYIAVSPRMADREQVRGALFTSQVVTGWAFPNALLQHALADLESMSIDLKQLQRKRDGMVEGLRGAGYEVNLPEGTFYLLVRSPIPDDGAFAALLAAEDVFVLPGSLMELPGYFRISLTASDEMIERALPVFRRVIERATR